MPARNLMVSQPGDWPWSSHAAHVGGRADPLLAPHAEYLALGADEEKRCIAYQALFKQALGDERLAEIRACVQQQRALGTPRFQREIEAVIGRCASVRAAHRPRRGKGAAESGYNLL